MEVWRNKVAVVTGAGAGIGAQIAEMLAKGGMTVIGLEPTEDEVEKMCLKLEDTSFEGQIIPCKCDISKDEDLKQAFDSIVRDHGGVSVLINNAAIGKDGMISVGDDKDIENFKNVIDVNFYGLVACTRIALESMLEKDSLCQIININSICGHYMPSLSSPRFNVYIASKQFMTSMTELLDKELKYLNKNIRVSSVSPGIVRTGVFKSAGSSVIDDDFFRVNPYLTPQDVADVVIMSLSTPSGIVVREVIVHALNEIF